MPPNVTSDQSLQRLLSEISMENAVKLNTFFRNPKTRSGLIQIIRMDKSTGQKRINPTALTMAKTLWSFGRSECNRVKVSNILR